MDGDARNTISTAPGSPNVAWDQCLRLLPRTVDVAPGQALTVSARRTESFLTTICVGGYTEAQLGPEERGGCIGAPQLYHFIMRPTHDSIRLPSSVLMQILCLGFTTVSICM